MRSGFLSRRSGLALGRRSCRAGARRSGPASRKLATDKFADLEAGITALAATGDPQAAPTHRGARPTGELTYDPASQGALLHQRTAANDRGRAPAQMAAPPPAGLKPVRLNNRVRRAVEAALGSLTLLRPTRRSASPPPTPSSSRATRRRCRRSRRRLQAETDPRAKRALEAGACRDHPAVAARARGRSAAPRSA